MADLSGDDSTPARIIRAALTCIEREGIGAVTSRSIAREAKVNLAALNYHFGSKSNVIEKALGIALDSAFRDPIDDFARLMKVHSNVRRAAHALIDEMMAGAIRHPRTGFAVVHDTLVRQKYDTLFAKRLNALMDDLYPLLCDTLRGETEAEKRASLTQLWSAMMFVGLMPQVYQKSLRVDLTHDAKRRAYVQTLVDCHFKPRRSAS